MTSIIDRLPELERGTTPGRSSVPLGRDMPAYMHHAGTIRVILHKATNLAAKVAKTNARVNLKLGADKKHAFHSKVVNDSSNPVFDQHFDFEATEQLHELLRLPLELLSLIHI